MVGEADDRASCIPRSWLVVARPMAHINYVRCPIFINSTRSRGRCAKLNANIEPRAKQLVKVSHFRLTFLVGRPSVRPSSIAQQRMGAERRAPGLRAIALAPVRAVRRRRSDGDPIWALWRRLDRITLQHIHIRTHCNQRPFQLKRIPFYIASSLSWPSQLATTLRCSSLAGLGQLQLLAPPPPPPSPLLQTQPSEPTCFVKPIGGPNTTLAM